MELQPIAQPAPARPPTARYVGSALAVVGLALLAVGAAALKGRQSWTPWPHDVSKLLIGLGTTMVVGPLCCSLRRRAGANSAQVTSRPAGPNERPAQQRMPHMDESTRAVAVAAGVVFQSDGEFRKSVEDMNFAQVMIRLGNQGVMTIFRKVATSDLGRPDATTLADLTSERDRVLWQRLIQLFPEVTKLLDSSVDPAVASGEPVTWGAARLKLELLGKALLNLQSGDSVGQLVAMGAPLWARDESYNTPLLVAALRGRNELIQPLLDAGADVNESGRMVVTPLMQSARVGDVLGARLLLAARANVDARTQDGETALLLALGGGHGPMVDLLLDEGHAQINNNDPLLLVAIRSRCAAEPLIKRLLEAGASAHQILVGRGRAGPNPFMERISTRVAANEVLKEGWMAPVAGQEGWTPLIMAAEKGNEAAVRMLVTAAEINLNVQAEDGRTALMVAADYPQERDQAKPPALPGHDAVIRQLITARADLALRDGQDRTALMIATERGRDAAAALLTDAAAGQLPAPAKASD